MNDSLYTRLSTRLRNTIAGFLDGVVLHNHGRIVGRRQHEILPRLPASAEFDHKPIASLFPSPPPIPLDHIRGAAWERRGRWWRRDFAFPSSVPTAHPQNRSAIVQTYAHDRALHFPGVITLHGWMTPTVMAYRPFFRAIVEAGASAYALELPYHLRRTPAGFVSGELFFTADFEMSWTAMQQAVADTRQLIHYLRGAGAPVIGLMGFSLGAWVTAIVASCEPELDFALIAMPPARLNDLIWQTPLGKPWRRQFEAAGWGPETTAPFYHPIDPIYLTPLIPPARREFFMANYDHFMPLQYTQALLEAWQPAHWHHYHSSHIGLIWSRKLLRDVRQSLVRQLAFGKRQETPVTIVTDAVLHNLAPFAKPIPTEPQIALKK